jgi:hypothetical protein
MEKLCTNEPSNEDKIFLNYIAGHKNYICKTISADKTNAANPSPVDWKFVSKPVEFYEFETTYEIATTFPLPHTKNQFDTEECIISTIGDISGNLMSSIMFFNGEPYEPEMTVEKFVKNIASENAVKVAVTIYSDATHLATNENGVLTPHQSLVKYTGIVSSLVYGAPRNTLAEIGSYIRNDIKRSITARMGIYYDAILANDDGGNEDNAEKNQEVNSTVPPRRVFFPIGNSSIKFCDYLFHNENEEMTVKEAKDILGVKLEKVDVDLEAEAPIQVHYPELMSNAPGQVDTGNKGNMIIAVGIAGLVIALIVTVILHFLIK